jgi:hypothetical protein
MIYKIENEDTFFGQASKAYSYKAVIDNNISNKLVELLVFDNTSGFKVNKAWTKIIARQERYALQSLAKHRGKPVE